MTLIARSPVLEVQRLFYTVLSDALAAPVFDNPPEGLTANSFPYVGIGQAVETPDNRHGQFVRSVLAIHHVWSRQRGFTEALGIAEQMIAAVDHKCFPMPSPFRLKFVRFDSLRTLTDPDPEIRHVPVAFRLRVEQTKE